ncbi:MAG: type II toxin-antitoxin system ParD family antitoxin [Candidatus Saccharimonas sp.]|nr:type II toxin-antitoxin system ParD family antitoxin [Planctomycetaceae bacterium]
MNYAFPPDVDCRVKRQLATGSYPSGDDVLRAAMTALEHEHDDLEAIQSGIADMEAGRFRPFSEIDAEFRRQHSLSAKP